MVTPERSPGRARIVIEAAAVICDGASFVFVQNHATALAVITKAVGVVLNVLGRSLAS